MQVFQKNTSPISVQMLDDMTGLGSELCFPVKNTGVNTFFICTK